MKNAKAQNQAAAGFMALATLGFSLTPPLIAHFGAANFPFFFNALIYAGQSAFLLALLFALNRRRGEIGEFCKLAARRTLSRPFLLACLAYANFGAFALSTRFVDVSLSTAAFGAWPIFMAILLGELFRSESRYAKLNFGALTAVLAGLAGFALIAISQTEGSVLETVFGEKPPSLGIGLSLALIAAALTSLSSYALRWGVDLSREAGSGTSELTGALAGVALAGLAAVPLNAAIGFALGESISELGWSGASLALVFAAVADGGGTAAYRNANLLTRNLGVNAMMYGTLPLSLLWLFALGEANVEKPELLAAGTALIAGANLGIGFSDEAKSLLRKARKNRATMRE